MAGFLQLNQVLQNLLNGPISTFYICISVGFIDFFDLDGGVWGIYIVKCMVPSKRDSVDSSSTVWHLAIRWR